MTTEEQLKLMAELARDHVSFEDIEDMNEAVRKYEDMFKLKGKILLFLKELKKHSCVYKGVSFCKRSSWAKIFKVSERTIKRWLDKLSKLGIIKDIPAFEPSGRQMWNHVVIQPLPVEEKVEEKQANVIPSGDIVSSHKDKSLKQNIKNNIKDVNTHAREEIELPVDNSKDYTPKYIPKHIPSEFVQAIRPVASSVKDIFELWGKVLLASKITGVKEYQAIDCAIEAAESTLANKKNIKNGTGSDSIRGYFFGAVKGAMLNGLEMVQQMVSDRTYGKDAGDSVPERGFGYNVCDKAEPMLGGALFELAKKVKQNN